MKTLALVVSLAAARLACADTITFSAPTGEGTATFDSSGGTLTVTLQNLSTFPNNGGGSSVLTALLFNLPGDPTLTTGSVSLSPGSSLLQVGSNTHTLGDEWQYLNFTSPYHSATQGISSTGLGIFGPDGNFGCTTTCDNLDGPGWGIVGTSYGTTGHTGNPALQNVPLVQDSLTFTLTGLPSNFDVTGITNVGFQFGTSTTEPFVDGGSGVPGGNPGGGPGSAVPEPTTYLLVGAGCLVLGIVRKRSQA